ncbi:eukaryotic polypeptide chain release factor 3 [Lichtheimia corymbifera JMRC:FSU:9682]|uniref:Eukaryotic peptide chain release factor GTP-binding subunit n=1 Tax=Lichtheimia corymbifera JMRC:FSU:9682 TaxID=1263082 RepID=A0A068RPQ3_9FUNG|nr:eukaryotic polypeptide chain release factor 3 [Lichtheimia corymbifera JMRC:FSU:9682]
MSQNQDSLSQATSKLSLNPNAASWKPNLGAKEFVPSFGAPAPAPAAPASSAQPAPRVMKLTSNTAPSQPEAAPAPAAPATTEKKAEPVKEEPKPAAESAPKPAAPKPKAAPKANKKEAEKAVEKAAEKANAVSNDLQNVDDEIVQDMYGKEHLNIVFMGHVDAGKSTMGGNILFLTGMVDKRTMDKIEKEAKDAGRETWYLSWALDTGTEERAKGKTVECGRAYFETTNRRYTILDAPGHKNYVPSMITGASQADVGVMVISARKGEFETGFERGGQTREHMMLAKTSGINKMIIAVNKMDDPTVEWDKARYDEILGKLTPFLKQTGYHPKNDVMFIPVSGYTGANIKDRVGDKCPWFEGPSLLEYLDNMKTLDRKLNAPLMLPIAEKYKDMGTIIVGKIESGHIKKNQTYMLMPNKRPCEISTIYNETEDEVDHAICGDNVRVRLKGVEEDEISPGFLLCDKKKPVKSTTALEAQLAILDHKNIICAGYTAVMHVHAAVEEITLAALLHKIDKKTGKKTKRPPPFVKQGEKVIARIETAGPICVETFEEYPQLGRFTIRDEGKTIAIGRITKVLDGTA